MQYRDLGATGLSVGEISLGCGGLEGAPKENVARLLDYALERGVNFLDM